MSAYIITVKYHKDKGHDPSNKKTGPCPVSSMCTDVTGQYHSFVVRVKDLDALEVHKQALRDNGIHVTRVERVEMIEEGIVPVV
jgi:hypothetical protein